MSSSTPPRRSAGRCSRASGSRRRGDLGRFAAYHLEVYRRYGHTVHTVVLYGAGIRGARDTLDTGAGQLVFHPRNILVGREDGDAALRRLHDKAARGEAFTDADRIDLILSPLMRQRRPVPEVARDAALLTAHLPQEEREMTVGALLGLSYPEISDDVAIAILGELGMTALSQALEARGEARGEIKGKREAIRRILRRRFGAIPATATQRIEAATTAQLDDLIDRAVAVENMDAF